LSDEQHRAPDQEISLASILNVLWRRRVIALGLPLLGVVVGLLYGALGTRRWEATVTIRPGITAFSPDGGPVREWRLGDITRWYDKRLYEPELTQRLGLPAGSRTVIRTEFAAQSLQDMAGGQIVTLWTTATSPELAAAIIDTSLVVFDQFATADTISSQIKLTQDGLRLQIERMKSQIDALAGEKMLVELRIAETKDNLLLITAEDESMALEIARLQGQQERLERQLEVLRGQVPALSADLARLDEALHQMELPAAAQQGAAEVPGWARRDAVLDRGSVLESVTRAKLQVLQAIARNQARQDSLSYEADRARLESAKLTLTREHTVKAKKNNVARKIEEYQNELAINLPQKHRELVNSMANQEVKLETISPLQRVGKTVTSDKPVRPRLARATMILFLLGCAAGVSLSFVWEYVGKHRHEIFRS